MQIFLQLRNSYPSLWREAAAAVPRKVPERRPFLRGVGVGKEAESTLVAALGVDDKEQAACRAPRARRWNGPGAQPLWAARRSVTQRRQRAYAQVATLQYVLDDGAPRSMTAQASGARTRRAGPSRPGGARLHDARHGWRADGTRDTRRGAEASHPHPDEHSSVAEEVVRGHFDGYDGFLRKPYDVEVALELIADLLERDRCGGAAACDAARGVWLRDQARGRARRGFAAPTASCAGRHGTSEAGITSSSGQPT